ncbi:MAG: LysR family transcriptional regulator [Eubacteriales bacterium]
MNIIHLRYAVEVEKTGSITQAAERLYMAQPNLSKAIKELESTLGIAIFKRSSKGIVPTKKGGEFLNYAKNILAQIDEMEGLFRPGEEKQRFNIAVPRASYIAHAFTRFINLLDDSKGMDIDFFETSSIGTINGVSEGEYDLGIVRYQKLHEKYFFSLLVEKELKYEPILEYTYFLLLSKQHDLAQRHEISSTDLNKYIEIAHGDLSLPLSFSEPNKEEKTVRSRRINVYERGSQFDLLRKVPATYMWVSPMPQELLDCYGLVQKKCDTVNNTYVDLLIYSKEYKLTGLDKAFIKELFQVRDEVSQEK